MLLQYNALSHRDIPHNPVMQTLLHADIKDMDISDI